MSSKNILPEPPGIVVLRPADAVEAAEAWEIALDRRDGPTAIVLSRQDLEVLRTGGQAENLSAQGGYVLEEAGAGARQVTLIATGSEVGIAHDARRLLEAEGIGTAVVSMPSLELFRALPVEAQMAVLGPKGGVRIGIEAAMRFGWDGILGEAGDFVGMTGYGASGPAEALYTHFGITAERVATRAREMLVTSAEGVSR